MRRSGPIALLVAWPLLGLVACGSGSPANTATPLPLKARLIKRGEFPGFTPGTPVSLTSTKAYFESPTGLTATDRTAWMARFTKERFKQDVTELLTGADGSSQALSGVMQLGSAASAQAELAAERGFSEEHGATQFSVKTIPGAVGYDLTNPTSSGENVLFADGPFLYIVGYGWYGSARNPKHAALVEAATKLYARVRGHPTS